MKNQQQMMKQLQQVQARMAKMQEELNDVTVEPEALEEGVELLSDLILAACNDALDKSRAAAAANMAQLTAGLGLPPGLL